MIKILEKCPVKPQPKNMYKFVIELMGGDADAYFYPEVFVRKDNPYLERFTTFLNNCNRGGFESYPSIPDYYLFCSEDLPDEIMIDGELVEFSDETEELIRQEVEKCGIYFNWESNYEYFGESSFASVKVTYFDEDGVEYKCKLE